MFCTKCGKELEENVRFCTNCGAEVEIKPAQEDGSDGAVDQNGEIGQPGPDSPDGAETDMEITLDDMKDKLEREADLSLCGPDQTENPPDGADQSSYEEADGEASEESDDAAPTGMDSDNQTTKARSPWSPAIIGITAVAAAAVTILSVYFVVISGREYAPISFTAAAADESSGAAVSSSQAEAPADEAPSAETASAETASAETASAGAAE